MTAESNRAAFPETARLVDGLREVFGADATLTWASENGREIGKRGPDGVQATQVYRPADEIKKHGRRGA